MNLIQKYLNRRQRQLDEEILFPKLAEIADGNEEVTERLIAAHKMVDPAWKEAEKGRSNE